MLDVLEALLKLGLHMVLMSWWVYSWLYRHGRLDPQGSRKEHENQLKMMRKQQQKERAAGRKAKLDGKQSTDPEDFWLQKWMWFGGGFYGMAALWTLLVVEALEFIDFVFGLPRFIASYNGGLVDLIITFFITQLQNFITAIIWVTYWDGRFSLLWFLVAYLGYLGGRELSKKYDALKSYRELRANWR